MLLGSVANAEAAPFGKPLEGVRILALEQMQALPFATQLLARLGADVVKIESLDGESGRGALPAMSDPLGRPVGATFLRNNLGKRSIALDLKAPGATDLVVALAGRFDVFAENFRTGAADRLGLGYEALARAHPRLVYLSVSGFGKGPTPYAGWPAYAAIAEAMSGIYEFARRGDEAPVPSPVGALGDIGTALFASVGVLAALRHRDRTGQGQLVDVAMLDAMVAMTDVVTNFFSMGMRGGGRGPLILEGFRAADGWFILQVAREQHFAVLARVVGQPQWLEDGRLATRQGWVDHLDDVIRPAIEGWAATMTKIDAAAGLSAAGLAAGPCLDDDEVVADPHVEARNMLVACPRTDGVDQPVLVPGNPIKMSKVTEGPERRVPWVGEDTEAVLATELGLGPDDLAALRDAGVLAGERPAGG